MKVARPLGALALTVGLVLPGARNASAQNGAAPPSEPPAAAPVAPEGAAPSPSAAAEPSPSAPGDQSPAPPPSVLIEPPAQSEPPLAPPAPEPVPPAPAPRVPEPPRLVPEAQQDRGVTRADARPRPRGEFGVEVDAALNVRLGSTSGYRDDENVGGAYAAALYWNAADNVALGLELQHGELGRGSTQRVLNLDSVEFSHTTAWLSGRFVPFRSDSVEGFVALRAGLSIQHVDAHGVHQEGSLLEPARSYSCTELDGPDLAFGGGLGARFGVGPRFALVTRVDGNAHRLSSAPIGGCAAGIGSTTSVGFGVGLAYEFGGGAGSSRAASRPRRANHTW